jgi:hypothetical protein
MVEETGLKLVPNFDAKLEIWMATAVFKHQYSQCEKITEHKSSLET